MGRLFWKFFFASWLTLLLAGVGVGSVVWWRQQLLENERRPDTLMTGRYAAFMVNAAANVLKFGGSAALRQFLQQPQPNAAPPVYAIDDGDRDILARDIGEELLADVRTFHSRPSASDALRMVTTDDGQRYLLFVAVPEERVNPHAAGAPRRWRHGPPPPKPPSPWLLVMSGTLASLLLSAALAWYFAKPIRSLRRAFNDVGDGHLGTRVADLMGKRQDELADLGRDFDHMAAQLERLVTAQQRLLHDVSHELRSPLARMQAAIGIAQQQPDKIPQTLERIERESQRISDLVGELLVLSRLEAGVDQGETSTVELDELLMEIVADASFEAAHKGVNIDCCGDVSVSLETRGDLLHRAIENVLRNAVQYSPAGGRIDIASRIDHAEHCVWLTIADQGCGVPDGDLDAIFKPFFCGAGKRPDSTGLGLTITRRAVETLNGAVTARNRPQGGLSIEMRLPLIWKRY